MAQKSIDETLKPIESVIICGDGIAANMAAAALSIHLPPSMSVTLVSAGNDGAADLFYGTVSSSSAYAFNLAKGLSEPKLVLESDATFSWGTKYIQWASGDGSWIQCFHLALPIIDGVMLHHYLTRQNVWKLEPFLAPAVAARSGKFAHPPQQPGQSRPNPLSRAEYGYQFDPFEYGALFASCADSQRLKLASAPLADVECDDHGISALRLTDGSRLAADLYVDTSGPKAMLLTRLGANFIGEREICGVYGLSDANQSGAPIRSVRPARYGWQAETPIRDKTAHLTVYDKTSESEAQSAHKSSPQKSSEVTLGQRTDAWMKNCVGIGHAAYVVEPLTPAPIMLLQGDIDRLLSLIPFSADMSVERREYNRRLGEDIGHAALFNRALYETDNSPESAFWRAAKAQPVPEKLARKLELFQDRGVLVGYDLEPFHPEDWTILHYGMGRTPRRYDRSADRAPPERVDQYLTNMKRDIESTVKSLPDARAYSRELMQYLSKKKL